MLGGKEKSKSKKKETSWKIKIALPPNLANPTKIIEAQELVKVIILIISSRSN